jgi:hypothetical protein
MRAMVEDRSFTCSAGQADIPSPAGDASKKPLAYMQSTHSCVRQAKGQRVERIPQTSTPWQQVRGAVSIVVLKRLVDLVVRTGTRTAPCNGRQRMPPPRPASIFSELSLHDAKFTAQSCKLSRGQSTSIDGRRRFRPQNMSEAALAKIQQDVSNTISTRQQAVLHLIPDLSFMDALVRKARDRAGDTQEYSAINEIVP